MKKLLTLTSLLVAASLALGACAPAAGATINSLADLEGQAVCAGTSTTYETWLNHGDLGLPAASIYAEAPANITVVALETDNECAQAWERGDFVAWVTSETTADASIANGVPVRKLGTAVFSEDLAAAFDRSSSLDTTSLRSEVDRILADMHADGRLTALSNQWLGGDLTPSPSGSYSPSAAVPAADGDLLSAIKERGYILVSTDPNYEPQSFLNTEGSRPADTICPADALTTAEMQGFDVDVAKAIGDELGVETCFATPSWDVITAGSWADKWDLSVGSMTITTQRQEVLDFSIPYYYTPAVVLVAAE